MLAPICLFTYNRLEETKQTVAALKANYLASESDLIVFSDGAKNEEGKSKVQEVRKYIKTIDGFKSIIFIESNENKGLANSIISGVTQVINKHGRVIVLEDDLLTTPNFLNFMNQSLEKYEDDKLVFSVSGFIFDLRKPSDYSFDVFFTKRHCSWGWAIWRDRWSEINWDISDDSEYINNRDLNRKLNAIGNDIVRSLNRQKRGTINSWAIRCNYHQAKRQTHTVYPISSKVENIGFGLNATHTNQRFNKYRTTLDSILKREFSFPSSPFINNTLLRRFTRKYSLLTSVFYNIINKIS